MFSEFPFNSKGNALFHHPAFYYSCGAGEGFCDCIRNFPWDNRVYFRKSGHVCTKNKKGNVYVNVGQLEDEIS